MPKTVVKQGLEPHQEIPKEILQNATLVTHAFILQVEKILVSCFSLSESSVHNSFSFIRWTL